MNKRSIGKLAGLVGTAALTFTAITASAQEKVIKVAVMMPISGPASYFGVMGRQGIELAAEHLNKTGVNGYKFQVQMEDSQCAPLAATNTVKRSLENFKPHVLIGEECSDASLAIAPLLEAAKIPMINAGSATMKLTEQGYKYVFRIFPNADQQVAALAKNTIEKLGAKRTVLLYEKTNAGIDIADSYERVSKAMGGTIVGRIDFDRSVNDFTSIATRIASMGPVDVLSVAGLEGQTVKLAQALAQAGVTKGGGGKAIMTGTIWLPYGFDQKAGKASTGFIRVVQFDPNEQRPMVQNFIKEFKAKYGADQVPSHINAHAYDALLTAAEAVRMGGTNAQSIRDNLAKIKRLEVTTGFVNFDAKGQNIDPSVIHFVETQPDLSWKTLTWK